ncbi:MAG: family 10 glycosylhydrolase [Paucibacter sp.]|nr:family 10 glycosylhydrolase [Roseateles sp.]
MKRRSLLASSLALTACAELPGFGPRLTPALELASAAPAAPREFRGAWVATVANIDWPSRRGLGSAEQQAEARALLDAAVALKLNAIVFQVRTGADALYDSKLEPWSEYLSGTQGQSPEPFYDPLAFWVAEAHARGLELHAWLNPFRARQSAAKSAEAASHISKTHPDWVKTYGDQLWIDPGEPGAADHTLAVVRDIISRYDIDAIHIDDYFYPYAISDKDTKQDIDFPDDPSWQRYTASGGTLTRADWRRSNVDALIARLYEASREIKPHLRFGISPFGLPKPALRPEGISGYSQYDKLYADVEHWLEQGWLDYLVPQLYWKREQKAQAFGPLLQAWRTHNPRERHIYAGMFTSKVTTRDDSWPVDEITGQIALQREIAPGMGHVHFSMIALQQNRRGLGDALKAGAYAQAALTPAMPWRGDAPANAPTLSASTVGTRLRLSFDGDCAVWLQRGDGWELRRGAVVEAEGAGLTAVVAARLGRSGLEGPRAGWRLAG